MPAARLSLGLDRMNLPLPAAQDPVLAVTDLVMGFAGTVVLDHVSFDVRRGEVHALLGQNGAGKSTLIKILAGMYLPLAGRIQLGGRDIHPAVERVAINFIHQDLGLVDAMSVGENIAIGAGYPRRGGLIAWRQVERAARDALETMASDIEPLRRVADLSLAEKSIVAIARALATNCEVLVLDEPTAALPEADVERLFAALERLRDRGLGIVYVTHRLDEVSRLANRVTVLRDGRRIATAEVAATTPQQLVEMIVGRNVVDSDISSVKTDEGSQLIIDGLKAGEVGPVSFSLMPGETLALVGLRGAGHETIARAVFGDAKIESGLIKLSGKVVWLNSPASAIACGIGFISSKRAEESVAATLSVRENLFMNPGVTGIGPLNWLSLAREQERSARVIDKYSIRPRDSERSMLTLSGGNQQKVIVARWLEGNVALLILEEPTAGVDVGSKAEIYSLMQQFLSMGSAILLVSTDFEEVARVAHRALVFDRGRIVAEISRSEMTVARLTSLAAGDMMNEKAV